MDCWKAKVSLKKTKVFPHPNEKKRPLALLIILLLEGARYHSSEDNFDSTFYLLSREGRERKKGSLFTCCFLIDSYSIAMCPIAFGAW